MAGKPGGTTGQAATTAPRKRRESRAQIDLASLPDDGKAMGQSDQLRWAHEMTRTESDVQLSRHGSQLQTQGGHEELHSRMLTKRQLSDMAWGVRELSRRLSSMRIKFRVKSILILTKIYDLELIPKTRELAKWLLEDGRHVQYTVFVQDKLKDSKKFDAAGLVDELVEMQTAKGKDGESARQDVDQRLRYWSEDMCRSRPHTFDFVITLGGDGTVLYASWLFQRIVPPILSFALGSLGFLTKFDFEDYEDTLASAFDKGVTVSLRLRFESTVMRSIRRKVVTDGNSDRESSSEDEEEMHRKRDLVEELIGEEKEDFHTHRPDGTFEILNEVVVDRGPNPSMCHLHRVSIIMTAVIVMMAAIVIMRKMKSMLTDTSQPCRIPKSLATTSTLHPCSPTASASLRLRVRLPITSQQAGHCAIPRTL